MALDAPLPLQSVDEVSRRQAKVVCGWLDTLARKELEILEVGCGTGWFGPQETRFGRVTGTDLSDEVLARAQRRSPEIAFVPGGFMSLDLGTGSFLLSSLWRSSHAWPTRAHSSERLPAICDPKAI